MLHTDLHIPLHPTGALRSIIQQPDLPARNDLLQPPINRIPYLHKATALIDQHEIPPAPKHGLARFAHKFHHHGPRDIPQLININPHLLETKQELRVVEPEHAQRPLIPQPQRDARAVRRLEVRDAERDLLIQRHDLHAPRRRDRDARVEEIDGVRFGGDVEVVEVAEEFGRALAHAEQAAPHAAAAALAALLVHRFQHFEGRADTFAFLVEDERAVFHAGCGEEADVAVAGEFLGRVARRGVVLLRDGGEGGWADSVEMVGYEGFVRDEEEEGEFFEDGDLGHAGRRNSLDSFISC